MPQPCPRIPCENTGSGNSARGITDPLTGAYTCRGSHTGSTSAFLFKFRNLSNSPMLPFLYIDLSSSAMHRHISSACTVVPIISSIP